MGLFEKAILEEKELFQESFEKFLETRETYSERYKVKDDGILSKDARHDDNVVPYLISFIDGDVYHNDFYSLIHDLESELTDFSFRIEEDKNRQWIKYEVKRK